jgi:hypothetical protein
MDFRAASPFLGIASRISRIVVTESLMTILRKIPIRTSLRLDSESLRQAWHFEYSPYRADNLWRRLCFE